MGRKFYRAIRDLADKLGCYPHDLLAVLYLESSLKPAAFNPLTSTVGLLQFKPSTLKHVGYHDGVYKFQTLSAWEQVPYIDKYLSGVAKAYGPLNTIDRLYRAVLYPISLTKGDDIETAIFAGGSTEYASNKGLDLDADGVVTIKDIRTKFALIMSQDYSFDKYLTEMFWDGSQGSPYPPDVITETALRYVDVGTGLDRERYLEVMAGPEDRDAQMTNYFMAGPSTCALFARGVWRISGVESGILSSRYRIGHAVSDLVEIARAHNAWHSNPVTIEKGDVFILNNPEHVCVVISDVVEGMPNTIVFDTVEGGQAPNSSYVRRFTRKLELKNGKLWSAGRYNSYVIGRADAVGLLT